MNRKILNPVLLLFLWMFTAGCSSPGAGVQSASQPAGFDPAAEETRLPAASAPIPAQITTPTVPLPGENLPTEPAPVLAYPASPIPSAQATLPAGFEIGNEITIPYLQQLVISGSEITFEESLPQASNYQAHIASYRSEGNRIYGLLTVPLGEPPEGGFKAIVFNHGYIPPAAYRTTERYAAYVDYLARSGFVVFKIDYRGHGMSEGEPTGSYFSPGYTIDAISALKSLQMLDFVDPNGIGMWGHSMAGNLVLRAMLIEPEVKAGVIWAGAVYSYVDFVQYGIDDNTYRPPENPLIPGQSVPQRRSQEIFSAYGPPDAGAEYWQAVSLTDHLEFLTRPLQLHHAEDDEVVSTGYSSDLAAALQANGKEYEFYTYPGGGHNLASPSFEQAMQRTVEFFRRNL